MRAAPTGLNIEEIEALCAFSSQLADAAAAISLKHFRSDLGIDNKLDGNAFDPVTIADRDAEAAIRKLINKHYPAHGIIGEEHGSETGSTPVHWVLDPIDGTRSFISGVPLWGTLIALNDGSYPTIGTMDQPYLKERYIGRPGKTEFIRNGKTQTLTTRSCSDLSDAILGCTDPAMFTEPGERDAFMQVSDTARLTRYGTDCYFYCLVAAGYADIVVESALQPYDIQALIPIVEGAGGVVTTWQGKDPQQGGRIVAAGDARVHAQALEILSQVK